MTVFLPLYNLYKDQTFYWYARGQLFIYRIVTMFTDVVTDYTAGDNDE
jgi:hypothetical protein